MTFEEARERSERYLQQSNDAIAPFERVIRRRITDDDVLPALENMTRYYVLSVLCHIYAGLLKDPEYAMGYIEEVIEKEGDDFSEPPIHRGAYRED